MKRRSFLSALGLAPLAAWLSSRAEAKAPEPFRVVTDEPWRDSGAWDVEYVEPRVRVPQLDFVAPVPQLREWLGPNVVRIGVVCQPGASTGECWILPDDRRCRRVSVKLRDTERVVTNADVNLPVYAYDDGTAMIGGYTDHLCDDPWCGRHGDEDV